MNRIVPGGTGVAFGGSCGSPTDDPAAAWYELRAGEAAGLEIEA